MSFKPDKVAGCMAQLVAEQHKLAFDAVSPFALKVLGTAL
jgi:stage V sporulation protein SpoVS